MSDHDISKDSPENKRKKSFSLPKLNTMPISIKNEISNISKQRANLLKTSKDF